MNMTNKQADRSTIENDVLQEANMLFYISNEKFIKLRTMTIDEIKKKKEKR